MNFKQEIGDYKVPYVGANNPVSQYQMAPLPNQMHPSDPQQYKGMFPPAASQPMTYRYQSPGVVLPAANDLVSGMAAMGIGQMAPSLTQQQQQTELNLAANEFYPKTVPSTSALHQSTSAPSFDGYQAMAGKPMNSLLDNVHSQSPVLTPSSSPRMVHHRGTPRTSPPPDQQQDLVQENFGGTTYFYNKEEYVSPATRQVYPNAIMYTGMLPHVAHMKHSNGASGYYMGTEMQKEMLERQAVIMSEVEGATDVPSEVDSYSHLVPLELGSGKNHSDQFRYSCTVYKAVNRKDGLTYCLRRIHGFKLTNQKMDIIDRWKKLTSVHVVNLREVFTTKSFGDNSLIFVYDFHPNAETLWNKHFANNLTLANGYSSPFNVDGGARPFSAGKGTRKPASGQLTEPGLWSYAIQLTSALRIIHQSKLSANGLNVNKILVSYKDKIRVNCGGVLDMVSYDPNMMNSVLTTPHLQKEDYHSLGLILLGLACNSPLAFRPEHQQSSLDFVKRNYSNDMRNLIAGLLTTTSANPTFTIANIMPIIGARFYTELETLHIKTDVMENELMKTCQNGRLFRLLAKLNTILERHEFNVDSQWSTTGNRYLLKLYRDYVFHSTTENGSPYIDMAHVISSLNKLDAGTPEMLCLSSTDHSSVIIVTYKELKKYFEEVFNELVQATVAPNPF